MKKFKILGAFILGIGITVLSSNVVFAEKNEDNKSVDQIIQIAVVDENLAKKQEEIDYIVFNENSKEIEEKGFTVVSTGMVDKFVEVRIEPYNEENAEYLYNILGRDMVKVVDAEQAELLDSDADSPDATFNITSSDEVVHDADLYIENDVNEKDEKSNGFITPLLILAVSALGGVAILASRKNS